MTWHDILMDWSEVWAPLIPLTVYLLKKPKDKWTKPLVIYLIIAFLINFTVDFLYHPYIEFKVLGTNYIFYNLSSAFRLIMFCWFFHYIHSFFRKLNKVLPYFYLALGLLSFIFLKDVFKDFNSPLMALETAVILTYCISWFNLKIRDEIAGSLFAENYSWPVIGITFYAALCFPIFLFYDLLISSESIFAYYIWDVHNFSFMVMCISFAIGFSKK